MATAAGGDESGDEGGAVDGFQGPADMPATMQAAWMLLSHDSPRAPVFVVDSKSGKLMLKEGKTHLDTLAPFLSAAYKDQNIYVSCMLHSAEQQQPMRLTYDARAKAKNIVTHFASHHADLLGPSMVPKEVAAEGGKRARGVGGAPVPSPVTEGVTMDEHRRRQLICMLMGGLPLNLANNPGWKFFLAEYSIPVVPRSTLGDWAKRMYQQIVTDPVNVLVTELRKPVSVRAVDGRLYDFVPKLSLSSDGWSGPNGEKYESVVLAGGVVKRTMLGGAFVQTLAPVRFPVAMHHYKPITAEGFSAPSLFRCWTEILAKLKLEPSDVFLATCDGEAVNPAAARLADWSFATCVPHAISNGAKDTRKDHSFAAASDAVRELSVWFRSSDKRAGALLGQQKSMGITRPLRTVSTSTTRFLEDGFQNERALFLEPAIARLDACHFDDATWRVFVPLRATFARYTLDLQDYCDMLKPLRQLYSCFGKEDEYTASTRLYFLRKGLKIVEPFVTKPVVGGAAVALKRGLLRRLASVNLLENEFKNEGVAPLGAMERAARLSWDDTTNCAAAMDPACWATFHENGGSVSDAVAYAQQLLGACLADPTAALEPLDASAVAAAAPVPGTLAARKTALVALVKDIKAQAKPSSYDAAAWAQRIAGEIKVRVCALPGYEVAVDYRRPPPYLHPAPQAAEAAAALPPQLAAAPDADDALYTRLEHMNAALVAEGALLFDRIVACETPRGPNYGSPFARTPARYTFWADPAACGSMPLLCFAARMVLVSQGSAMSNERLHSAIGMLTRKLRAKTTPENAEMFTLARHWLLRDAAAKLEALDVGELDAMEAADDGPDAAGDVAP